MKNPKAYMSFPQEFVDLLDKIVKENPHFKNRPGVIKYAVIKYHEELQKLKSDEDVQNNNKTT